MSVIETLLLRSQEWIDAVEYSYQGYKAWFDFAMLWISFNCYYSEKYAHISGEGNQIKEFAKDNELFYNQMVLNGLKAGLEDFKATNKNNDREYVSDMRQNSTKKVYFNVNHCACEDFLMAVYQVRCNFLHGDKILSDPDDQKLIEWARKYFLSFWKQFLRNEAR